MQISELDLMFLLESESSQFLVDLSRMGLGEIQCEHYLGLLQKALQDMVDLEAGAIANPDEGRQVGHYWLRNSALAPSPDVAKAIEGCVARIEEFSAGVRASTIVNRKGESFQDVVLVGIGGSALGPQLVFDALYTGHGLPISFVDNTDPDGMARVLQGLDSLERTLFLVLSKSGGTRETFNGELYIKSRLQAAGLEPGAQMVAITMEGSALHKRTQQEEWLESFPIWDWVGGRTSVFSAVGLLPAALHGVNIKDFLKGAADMDAWTRTSKIFENPALMKAFSWYLAGGGKGDRNMIVLPYRDRLLLFSRYLQQLVMESLGKREDLGGALVEQGLSVFGNKGSTDQHAFVQQLRDGRNDFFAVFIDVLADGYGCMDEQASCFEAEPGMRLGDYLQGFFLGTRRALTDGGRLSSSITLEKLSPYSLGQLIALFERAVGFYASLIGVNAYHQPGVEAGKKAANEILDLQRKIVELLEQEQGLTALEVVNRLGLQQAALTDVFSLLRRLVATGRVRQVGQGLWEPAYQTLTSA
jgi:glucose-6-phosphate isomerase